MKPAALLCCRSGFMNRLLCSSSAIWSVCHPGFGVLKGGRRGSVHKWVCWLLAVQSISSFLYNTTLVHQLPPFLHIIYITNNQETVTTRSHLQRYSLEWWMLQCDPTILFLMVLLPKNISYILNLLILSQISVFVCHNSSFILYFYVSWWI